jgi:glycosyltransferase involved in cell wall biosynthesis
MPSVPLHAGIDVSVLTPSLNQGPFLRHCLESVQQQAGVTVEHIVMDGGSGDETLRILEEFAESAAHAVVWKSERDAGQAHALNKALNLATGRILGWLNADEYYEPDVLRNIVNIFDADSEVDLVYGDYRRVTATGVPIKVNRQWTYDREVGRLVVPIAQTCASFMRTDAVRRVGAFDDDFHFIMDWDLFIRLMRHGRCLHVPEVISNFTMHASTKTSKTPPGWRTETARLLDRELPGVSTRRRRVVRTWHRLRMASHMARDGVLLNKVAFGLFVQHRWVEEFGKPGPLDALLHPRVWRRFRAMDRSRRERPIT